MKSGIHGTAALYEVAFRTIPLQSKKRQLVSFTRLTPFFTQTGNHRK
jgi:hypothetical protein